MKTLIYPYDLQFASIVRHKDLVKDLEIVALVSPRGWSMNGKDGGVADNADKLGIIVSHEFENSLNLCDAVLFSDYVQKLDFESIIFPKIFKSIELKKDIIITNPLSKKNLDLISKKCDENKVRFEYYGPSEVDYEEIPDEVGFIHDINTPVIFVVGMGERTNKFEVQLSLRESIQKIGYKVSQIGTRSYCELLGFHSFPSFMYSKKISETDKIIYFNHFVKDIEIKEQPDLIIIGIPGGIFPINNKFLNNFGILAYEVSQAVTPDSTILSLYYGEYISKYFTSLKESVRYRFGCDVNCFNMSNVAFDWTDAKYENKLSYISIQSKYIDKKIEPYKVYNQKVFNILNKNGNQDMAQYIIDLLADFGQTECV
ncbi:UNVERIFIED_CONTAM: peptide maturation system protein (TIGR04066 family) [Acetivibrio alkalicellulosi]